MSYTLAEIAEKIGAVVQGDEQCNIVSLATLASATSGPVSYTHLTLPTTPYV